ncbi:hypothetical protein OG936_21340 [Streptomyces sp. NBC_00846]|uniref:hypothetical protein n=1 Tax=Streptomyces sp. NBC_00846 TaxID=2975849 RepID=UPI003867B1AA|nr:hypothetical protein OG936_21340 [Streptomyces sp. NBC_00846]
MTTVTTVTAMTAMTTVTAMTATTTVIAMTAVTAVTATVPAVTAITPVAVRMRLRARCGARPRVGHLLCGLAAQPFDRGDRLRAPGGGGQERTGCQQAGEQPVRPSHT